MTYYLLSERFVHGHVHGHGYILEFSRVIPENSTLVLVVHCIKLSLN